MEFLTSSAHYAARQLHANGYIPLWQPYLGEGRPLLESPFAFILNPFSSAPSLILGDGVRGIKASVVIYAVLAAYGGWFCGYAFGMGALGRVLLALLMLGKGNMVALLGIGHFQLGVSQAYMPWIIGAAFMVLRGDTRRWVAVLLALAFALQFLAGNVWHVLPTLISVIVLTLAYLSWGNGKRVRLISPLQRVNWRGVRRMVFAAALTVGMSAAVLLPLVVHRDYISGQDLTADGDRRVSATLLLRQYVSSEPLVWQLEGTLGAGELETRYNYTVPLWFVVGLLLIPLHRSQGRGAWRVWAVALLLFAFFTAWGVGGLQPFRWAYNNLPGLGRWRFVGRAFGMASFWLALLVALRADGLWRALLHTSWLAMVRYWLAGVLLAASLTAGLQVTRHNWREWVETVPTQQPSAACLAYLIAQNDPQPLIVNQRDYIHVQMFLDLGVRHYPIAAAYRPLSVPYTAYDYDLRKRTLPRYAMPTRVFELDTLADNGFAPVAQSPLYQSPYTGETWRCLWARQGSTPYAFSVREDAANRAGDAQVPLQATRPLTVLAREGDYVAVLAEGYGGAQALAAVQEVAYPGWRAFVDGERVPLESVGGYVGASLPLSTDAHVVLFVYRPAWVYVGAAVTLATAAFCVAYLLRVDRWGQHLRGQPGRLSPVPFNAGRP